MNLQQAIAQPARGFQSSASWGKLSDQPASVWSIRPIGAPIPGAGKIADKVSLQAVFFFGDDADERPTPIVNAPMWLEDIYSLVAQGKVDDAIDVLFHNMNAMFRRGEFVLCNEWLRAIDLKRLDANLLVGLLTITRSVSAQLSFRAKLVTKIEELLQSLAPGRAERILNGLR